MRAPLMTFLSALLAMPSSAQLLPNEAANGPFGSFTIPALPAPAPKIVTVDGKQYTVVPDVYGPIRENEIQQSDFEKAEREGRGHWLSPVTALPKPPGGGGHEGHGDPKKPLPPLPPPNFYDAQGNICVVPMVCMSEERCRSTPHCNNTLASAEAAAEQQAKEPNQPATPPPSEVPNVAQTLSEDPAAEAAAAAAAANGGDNSIGAKSTDGGPTPPGTPPTDPGNPNDAGSRKAPDGFGLAGADPPGGDGDREGVSGSGERPDDPGGQGGRRGAGGGSNGSGGNNQAGREKGADGDSNGPTRATSASAEDPPGSPFDAVQIALIALNKSINKTRESGAWREASVGAGESRYVSVTIPVATGDQSIPDETRAPGGIWGDNIVTGKGAMLPAGKSSQVTITDDQGRPAGRK